MCSMPSRSSSIGGLGVALVPDWPPPWPADLSLTRVPVGDAAFDRHVGMV
jgi:hypothetical protein